MKVLVVENFHVYRAADGSPEQKEEYGKGMVVTVDDAIAESWIAKELVSPLPDDPDKEYDADKAS